MRCFAVCLALGLFVVQKAPGNDIKLKTHFTENIGGRCGWAVTDSLLRNNGYQINGLMKQKEGAAAWRIALWLKDKNVACQYDFSREKKRETIFFSCDKGFGCLVSIGQWPEYHALAIVGYNNNVVKYVDPNEPWWIQSKTWKEFEKEWKGDSLTIYPNPKGD